MTGVPHHRQKESFAQFLQNEGRKENDAHQTVHYPASKTTLYIFISDREPENDHQTAETA